MSKFLIASELEMPENLQIFISYGYGAMKILLKLIEGEEKKSLQNILFHITKVITPTVKSQARRQNNRSIALK